VFIVVLEMGIGTNPAARDARQQGILRAEAVNIALKQRHLDFAATGHAIPAFPGWLPKAKTAPPLCSQGVPWLIPALPVTRVVVV
jgi:hypothetical protein